VLGHEACIEVVDHRRSSGGHDSALAVGDRLTFTLVDNCGQCEPCLNDLSQKCAHLFKYGHASIQNGTGFNGCYASHIVIRKGTKVIRIPDEISDDVAATVNCALATMVNCVEQIPSHVRETARRVLVQGDGMLGLYGCVLLRELGVEQVFCSGNKEVRSDLIKKFGAIPISDGKTTLFDIRAV
jgi:D-arabinose 1-dehydrogenase-like Zn-dependent alcohol dehydrogenase